MWGRVNPVKLIDVSEERITTIFRVHFIGSTPRHMPEDGILHSHRCEGLKSYKESS
jgi:hypothetical protein